MNLSYRTDLHTIHDTNFTRLHSLLESRFARADAQLESQLNERFAALERHLEHRSELRCSRLEREVVALRRGQSDQLNWILFLWATSMVWFLAVFVILLSRK